jgi:hypothetical protein
MIMANTRERRKPTWSKYSSSSTLSLKEAVALSCDIEPDDIDLERDRDDPALKLFWLRLADVERAVANGELPTVEQQ